MDTFIITGYFHFFERYFFSHIILNITGVFSICLQVGFNITVCFQYFTGCVQYYRLFSVFLQVFFRKTYRVFSIFLHDPFEYFYRLVVKLQVSFIVFTGCFRCFYRLFSELHVFSVFLQVICNFTGNFFLFLQVFFQYYRLFSIFTGYLPY